MTVIPEHFINPNKTSHKLFLYGKSLLLFTFYETIKNSLRKKKETKPSAKQDSFIEFSAIFIAIFECYFPANKRKIRRKKMY